MNTITITRNERIFFDAYIEALYFTETGDLEQPEADAELCPEFIRESLIDCLAMYSRIACYLSDDQIEQAGHDFWLTRNHHGAGYWDRPEIYGEYMAKELTDLAHAFGDAYPSFEELT